MKKLLLIATMSSLLVVAWCGSATIEHEDNNKPIVSYTTWDVATHATADSCRSIIRGQVYDFTTRAGQHPWWSEKILAICGTDATPIFEKVHGGKEKQEMKLNDFYIGDIIVNRQ